MNREALWFDEVCDKVCDKELCRGFSLNSTAVDPGTVIKLGMDTKQVEQPALPTRGT